MWRPSGRRLGCEKIRLFCAALFGRLVLARLGSDALD